MTDHTRWPLVGRGAALELVRAVLADDLPRSVVIMGAAGLGRTRLAREAAGMAAQLGRPVRWVSATESAALVPLGALVHLVPTIGVPADPLVLLQRAAQAVVGDRSSPVVLVVDDVHLLDPLSVTLLHQLVAGGAVSLVLTVRTDLATPDPTGPLWKDGLAARVELAPLTLPETARVIARVLDGELESRTVQELWRLTGGTPMFLRELVDDGLRSRALRPDPVLWRWTGPLVPSRRLVDIVVGELGVLPPDERQALEVVATFQSVDVNQLVELSSPEAVASLERRGILVDSGSSGELRMAHPMLAAVLRSRAPRATVRLARRQLLAEGPGKGARDPLRVTLDLLDSGLPVEDSALLTAAARRAFARREPAVAERLAAAAVDAGAGLPGLLALLHAQWWLGRGADLETVAARAVASPADDVGRARLGVSRALILLCGVGRPDDAVAVLDDVGATVGDAEGRTVLAVGGAALSLLSGDVGAALDAVRTALTSLPPASGLRPLAAGVASVGLAVAGRTSEALEVVRSGRDCLASAQDVVEPLLADLLLAQGEVFGLLLAGRIDGLHRRAAELKRRNLSEPEWAGDPVASLLRGLAGLAAGRARDAAPWLREARGGLGRLDPLGIRTWSSSLLTVCTALLGVPEVEEAEEPAGVTGAAAHLFAPVEGLARAFAATAQGRAEEAVGPLLEGAALAAAQGQPGVQALLLHAAVRLGSARQVAPVLEALAAELDAPLVVLLAEHATAVTTADAAALHTVAERFEAAGALLLAADAFRDEATVLERGGERRAATERRAAAAGLLRTCGLDGSTGIEGTTVPTLTQREHELAVLASRGMSNQSIADRLVLSVRTVEAHLSHVYSKFGISSRAELVTALSAQRQSSGR